jgi:hypothetical protein
LSEKRLTVERVLAGAGALVLIGGLVYFFAGSTRTPADDAPADVTANSEDAPTLAGAVAAARPLMIDQNDTVSGGTLMLLGWSARHMKWADVAVKHDETTYDRVQDDVDGQRGKRMCVSGKIKTFFRVHTESASHVAGVLEAPGGHNFAFRTVGDPGTLDGGSAARLCGVVTGRNPAANAEGPARAVFLVGMFDLPENHPG